jgi:hypothetical protein
VFGLPIQDGRRLMMPHRYMDDGWMEGFFMNNDLISMWLNVSCIAPAPGRHFCFLLDRLDTGVVIPAFLL